MSVLMNHVASPLPSEDDEYCGEILVYEDGTVAFKHLDETALGIAAALNPHDKRLARRRGWTEHDPGRRQDD